MSLDLLQMISFMLGEFLKTCESLLSKYESLLKEDKEHFTTMYSQQSAMMCAKEEEDDEEEEQDFCFPKLQFLSSCRVTVSGA